jgi:hypothetical protein
MGAIAGNPQVALMYRHPGERVVPQFAGRARVVDGAERDRLHLALEYEQKADPEKRAWRW